MMTHNHLAAADLRRLASKMERLADEIEDCDPEDRSSADCAEQIKRHAEEWIDRTEENLREGGEE